MRVGEQVQLSARFHRSDDELVTEPSDARWTSLDPQIVAVDENGLATALTSGEARIRVEQDGVHDAGSVQVRAATSGQQMRWQAVDLGHDLTCALTIDGDAYCWGWDYWGGIGDGDLRRYTLSYTPVAVVGGHEFVEITAGRSHACGRTADGRGYCWGDSKAFGSSPGGDPLLAPERVAFSRPFATLQSGENHVCGLDGAGAGYCWGINGRGEIGDGTVGVQNHRYEPTPLQTDLRFRQIAPGHFRTCALDVDGRAHCWGRATPYAAPAPVNGDLPFESIAGQLHACGLTADRETYCWGENQTLQMGTDVQGRLGVFPDPLPLESDPGYVALAGGMFHTCGIREDGAAFCWGSNQYGQLGTDQSIAQDCGDVQPLPCTKEQLPVAGGLRFVQISASEISTCGITTDAALYCWGSNTYGQLGTGRLDEVIPVPTRVVDPF